MTDANHQASGRRRLGLAAILVLGLGWGMVMQSLGWAQTSYYAFVKALGDGTAQIDRYHWETRDKSYTNGHFFSVKAPGLPFLLLPLHEVLDAAGGSKIAREAADRARRGGARQWTYRGLNVATYGYSAPRAAQIKRRLETQAPLIWALGLLGTVIPAVLLLLLVRRVTDRIEPGLGTATALTLGMATLVMPFAVNLFGHILASLLAFGAFAVLWRERQGSQRLGLLLLAGLLAGLSVTTEYPLAIVGAIIGVYALTRPGVVVAGARGLLTRGVAYAGGVVLGVLPLLAYNLWAFGSITTTSYANAVDRQGFTGHDTLGLNSGGFFGIGPPDLRVALELLISPRGLLAMTPVVALGVYGLVLLHRRGLRAEAWTVAALALAFFVYDTGYWLPFGGGSPGAAIPDPGAAVPVARPRAGVAAPPGHDDRAEHVQCRGDRRRDADLPADRDRQHLAVVVAAEERQLPAHRPHDPGCGQWLAGSAAGAAGAARRRRPRRARHRPAAGPSRPADRARRARRLAAARARDRPARSASGRS